MNSVRDPEIRVVLADDHVMMREGLASIVDGQRGIRVVAQADGGHSAVRLTEEHQPDVLVLDYSMPDLQGPAVLGQLRAAGCSTRCLVLSTHESVPYATQSLSAGAQGYVVKSAAVEELVDAILRVQSGQRYLSRSLEGRMAANLVARPKGLDDLSTREFELLGQLGHARSLQEAAAIMRVSGSTASTYRARLMKKLGLRSTAEIIRFALENDIGNE